jgi:DNA repair/transcription protein MET18/MMS19
MQISNDEALDLLIQISNNNAEIIVESTLPLLFNVLPDKAPSRDAHAERAKCWNTLHRLSRLCVSAPLFETLVIRLTTKLELACDVSYYGSDIEAMAAYAHAILKTMGNTLETKISAKHLDVAKYVDRLLPQLYSLFIYLGMQQNECATFDERMLSAVAQVITSIVGTLSSECVYPLLGFLRFNPKAVSFRRQTSLARALHAAYFSGDVFALAKGHQQLPEDIPFAPFAVSQLPSAKEF